MRRFILTGTILCTLSFAAGCGDEETGVTRPGGLTWSALTPRAIEATTSVEVRLMATGGTAPYSYEAEASALPPGLRLSRDGILSGNPDRLGEFSFTVTVRDSRGLVDQLTLPIRIETPRYRGFPELLSQRWLTEEEMGAMIGSRQLRRMRSWAVTQGLDIDLSQAAYLDYDRLGADMVGVPLFNPDGTPSWGSLYFVHPFTSAEEGMAYRAFPSETNPHVVFYGGDGSEVSHNFTADRKWTSTTSVEGSGCGPTWQAFKRWLSSESGAEDLPWWLDLLCGIVCGDALLGTHNPWSISACLHCVGAYIAACIEVGPATNIQPALN